MVVTSTVALGSAAGCERTGTADYRPGERKSVEFERVVDGDTALMRVDGRTESVRYIGIDTPEMNWDNPDDLGRCARKAIRATDFNESRLESGRKVTLEFDEELRDRYKRILAYVRVDGRLLNAALLRRGLAETLTIPPNDRYADRFSALEQRADRRFGSSGTAC
jgi:micrococcal nuclease